MKKKIKSKVRSIDLRKTAVNKNTLAVAAALIIIAAAFYFTAEGENNSDVNDVSNFEEFSELASRERFWANPDRTTYEVPMEIFANLPPMPEDFGQIDTMIENGDFFAIGKLGEEYYKQPEFYPLFEQNLKFWTAPDFMSWGTNGYGTYPADQWTSVSPGTTFTAYTFFWASWNVQKWQGVGLVPVYPVISSDGLHNIVPAAEVATYFDVEITPDVFLLDPSFPGFGEDWTYKIAIRVHVKENTPPGQYVIGVQVAAPPAEYIEEWAWEHKKYYTNAASGFGMGRPQLRLMVSVR